MCGFLLIASRILSLIFDGLLHFLFFFFFVSVARADGRSEVGGGGGGGGALTF